MPRYLGLTLALVLVYGGHRGWGFAGDGWHDTHTAAVVVEFPPPPGPVSPGPPLTYWYYCHRPRGYYPQVLRCPGGWIPVVPPPSYAPPPPPGVVPPATPPVYWYYCQRPRGYYPQVRHCPRGWIPVVPTP